MKKMKSKRRPLGRRRIIVKQCIIKSHRTLSNVTGYKPTVKVFGEEVHLGEPMTILDSCKDLMSATRDYLKLAVLGGLR